MPASLSYPANLRNAYGLRPQRFLACCSIFRATSSVFIARQLLLKRIQSLLYWSQTLPAPCYCPGVKPCAVLLSLAALSAGASAEQVSGPVKPSSTFGRGLEQKTYTLVISVPSGLDTRERFGALTVEKSFFETLTFELSSIIPRNIVINEASWVVKDATAKSEVLLETKNAAGERKFSLYQRVDPAHPPVLLNCRGEAETQSVYQAMLKICRTAKLQ